MHINFEIMKEVRFSEYINSQMSNQITKSKLTTLLINTKYDINSTLI